MFMPNTSNAFDEAYIQGLRDLLEFGEHVPSIIDPYSPASNFGKGDRPAIELLGYSFQVNDPRQSLLQCDSRILRLPYCFGLFLWTIAGSNKVDWLSYYHSLAQKFSDDGVQLTGAFGKRLFAYKDTLNQMNAICERLTHDPSTHRALGTICTPEDNIINSREYPCCLAVQYFLRNGALHAITYMRAQQALTVLPYDAFLFMALQCFLAARLDVKVGSYKHIAGTFHIFEQELLQAKEVILRGAKSVQIGNMTDVWTNMDELLEFESELRIATLEGNENRIKHLAKVRLLRGTTGQFSDEAKAILLLHSFSILGLHDWIPLALESISPSLRELAEKYLERAKCEKHQM